MPIQFTEAALEQLKTSVEEGDYIKMGVKGGGCSGYSYLMEVQEGCLSTDVVHEFGEIKVCIE